MKRTSIVAIVVVVILVGVAGTYYELGMNGSTGNTGNLSMSVADTPVANVSAVYLTFSQVQLHSANNSSWETFNIATQTINVYNVSVTNPAFLNSISLNAGKYTEIRLYIQNVSVVVDHVSKKFTMVSNYAIVNHPFNISAHGTTKMTIDFSISQSLNMESLIFTPYVGTVTVS